MSTTSLIPPSSPCALLRWLACPPQQPSCPWWQLRTPVLPDGRAPFTPWWPPCALAQNAMRTRFEGLYGWSYFSFYLVWYKMALRASPRVPNNLSQSMIFRKNEKMHLQQLQNSPPNLLALGKKPALARKDARTRDCVSSPASI